MALHLAPSSAIPVGYAFSYYCGSPYRDRTYATELFAGDASSADGEVTGELAAETASDFEMFVVAAGAALLPEVIAVGVDEVEPCAGPRFFWTILTARDSRNEPSSC